MQRVRIKGEVRLAVMKFHTHKILFILLFSFIFAYPNIYLKAQESSVTDSFFDLTFAPEFPKPNENVVVELKTFSTDLDRALISWSINGKVQKTGVGENKISFRAGPSGSTILIEVTIKPEGGGIITKSESIKPAGVDIFWQARTYTPPFYKGKSLFSNESGATIVAIPHFVGSNGKEIPPKNLIYKWKQGSNVLVNDSGYGKNSFELKPTVVFDPLKITVEVSSIDQTMKAQGVLALQPAPTQVILYRQNSLYGIMQNHALMDDYTLSEIEMGVLAVPYFFSASPKNSGLTYEWMVDGLNLPEKSKEDAINIRRPDKGDGSSNVEVSVKDSDKSFQEGRAGFIINFGAQRN